VNNPGCWLDALAARTETGRQVRCIEWERTSLGEPSGWPVELRSLVQLCLTTRFPMLVTWGPALHMIYNDGYRDLIGDKHPAALGAPLATVWTEIWDTIGPLVDGVTRTGEPVWAQHQRLLIDRHGFTEETYFTYSYSAAFAANGEVAGLVNVAMETTGGVVAQRRMAALVSLGAATLAVSRVTDVCVAAAAELAAQGDDFAHADVFLRVHDDLLLIASTRQQDVAPVETPLLRRVLAEQKPHVVRAPTADAESPPGGIALALVGTGTGPEGVLYIEPSPLLPYTAEHQQFLAGVAATIGAALDAAHARTVELGEQRHINETLQRAMLQPANDHPTVAARYRPAALNLAVGGDWYDVIDLDQHRRAMVVGDCVGHGLDAATTMGQLRTATRALLLEGHDPAAVLERLDRFATSIPDALGTSVVCAIIDRRNATVSYSRAGHLPPLLVDSSGIHWLDDAGGTLLNVTPDGRRPLATIDYAHDDVLLLYTDGLIERRGESLDDGFGRLATAAEQWFSRGARIHEIADGLLRDLAPPRRADDVVLVAKRLVVDP
jgi:hypothetical protein